MNPSGPCRLEWTARPPSCTRQGLSEAEWGRRSTRQAASPTAPLRVHPSPHDHPAAKQSHRSIPGRCQELRPPSRQTCHLELPEADRQHPATDPGSRRPRPGQVNLDRRYQLQAAASRPHACWLGAGRRAQGLRAGLAASSLPTQLTLGRPTRKPELTARGLLPQPTGQRAPGRGRALGRAPWQAGAGGVTHLACAANSRAEARPPVNGPGQDSSTPSAVVVSGGAGRPRRPGGVGDRPRRRTQQATARRLLPALLPDDQDRLVAMHQPRQWETRPWRP